MSWELLVSAAHEARKQGKLRLAAELMASSEDDRRRPPESHAYLYEFLSGVVKDALAAGDVETARFAVSKIKWPVERSGTLRLPARHQPEAENIQSGLAPSICPSHNGLKRWGATLVDTSVRDWLLH